MKRRDFLGALAAGAAVGCKRRSTTIPDVDPDIDAKNVPETIAVSVPVKSGQMDALHERLEAHVFQRASTGVHYTRMVPLPDLGTLLISGVFDDTVDPFVELLHVNAATVDPVFSLTEGYPTGGAADREALQGWLSDHSLDSLMLYSAFSRASEPAVREATQLRKEFLRFVQAVQRDPDTAEAAYTTFLSDNRDRIDTHREAAVDQLTPARLTAPEAQNPFTMIFDIREDWVKRLDKTLTDGEWVLRHFHIHPLKKIPTVHYARFARITRTKILFESVYDGEWDQYVTDFAVNIPKQLNLVWGGSTDYPKGGAQDAPALAAWLDAKRIDRDYFYMGYANATVKDIQASLELGAKLVTFSREAPAKGSALVRHVERFVHTHQELLG